MCFVRRRIAYVVGVHLVVQGMSRVAARRPGTVFMLRFFVAKILQSNFNSYWNVSTLVQGLHLQLNQQNPDSCKVRPRPQTEEKLSRSGLKVLTRSRSARRARERNVLFCCLMSQTPHVNHQWSGEANESLVSACRFWFIIGNKAIFMHINILKNCLCPFIWLFPEWKMSNMFQVLHL